MVVEIDDATIKHAVNLTCLLVVAMSFLGALLAQLFCVFLDFLAVRIARNRQRKMASRINSNA